MPAGRQAPGGGVAGAWRHKFTLLLQDAQGSAVALCCCGALHLGREVSQAQEGCADMWKPSRRLRVPKDIRWLWKAEPFQT